MTEPERSLPDDQVKIENEDEYEETELQTMERAMDLSKQFEEVKQRTVEDGMVLGKLVDIQTSANNDRISVEIDLPAEGDAERKRFRKPKRWSDEYNFVRWIKYYGYDADSFPNMIKDDCKVKVKKPSEGGDYELFVPEGERSYKEKISSLWGGTIWQPYKEGPPVMQVTSFITTLSIAGFMALGTIHLFPSRVDEAFSVLVMILISAGVMMIEDDIQGRND